MRRSLGLAALILFLGVFAAPAMAATKTFTGAVDSSWNTAGNWNPSGVPGSGDDVVINNETVHITGADASARSISINTATPFSGGLSIDDHTLTVSSSGTSTIDGYLNVAGTLDLGDPTTYGGSSDSNGINIGGTLNIGASFTMTGADSPDNAQVNATSNSALINVLATGALIRSTSSGVETIGPPVDNDGSASVQTGTLNLAGGDAGSTTGSYDVSSGATLQTHGSFEAPSITGSGSLDVAGGTTTIGATDTVTVPELQIDNNGTLTLNQDLSVATVMTTGGHRNGTGTLTVTGTADFSGLQLDSGTTTVAASVPSFDISHFLSVGSGATLNLDHATTYAGSSDSNGINVDGTLNIASSFTISGVDGSGAGTPGQINNSGLVHVLSGGSLIRDTSSGTVTISPSIENDGTVSVQTGTLADSGGLTQAGGLTNVAAGAILNGAVTLNGGKLMGDGTIGSVSNSGGTVAPGSSPGTLTITGNYSQGPGGTLAEEITGTTPGTQFDQLIVGGAVALDGTLAIDSSTFTPANTDTFKIITGAASRTGTFATLTSTSAPGVSYSAQYDVDGVTLLVNLTPPANTSPPSIPSAGTTGQLITCNPGTWTGAPTFGYSWTRDGTPISGASAQTYTLTSADEGHTIRCVVVGHNAGGNSAPATSNALTASAPTPPSTGGTTTTPATPPPPPTATSTTSSTSTAPPPPVAPPAAPAKTPSPVPIDRIASLPPAKACVSRRRFVIHLRNVKAAKIVTAAITLNGRQVRTVRGRALGLPINLTGLPKGTFTIAIITTDAKGKRVVGKRTYHTCVPKRRR